METRTLEKASGKSIEVSFPGLQTAIGFNEGYKHRDKMLGILSLLRRCLADCGYYELVDYWDKALTQDHRIQEWLAPAENVFDSLGTILALEDDDPKIEAIFTEIAQQISEWDESLEEDSTLKNWLKGHLDLVLDGDLQGDDDESIGLCLASTLRYAAPGGHGGDWDLMEHVCTRLVEKLRDKYQR